MKKAKRVNITKRWIDSTLKPPAKGYKLYWDEEQRSFGVRITKAGAVSFVVQSRIGTRERRVTIGSYPATSPDAARKKAGVEIGLMKGGTDPVFAKRSGDLAATTLAVAFREYTEEKTRSKDGLSLKQRTIDDMDHSLDWAFGSWKNLPIASITHDMVRRKYQQLAKSSKAQANLAFRYFRAVFNFQDRRIVDERGESLLGKNPVNALQDVWKRVPLRTTTIKPEQLPDWVAAVEALTNPVARDLLLFIALTGCRRSEALTLKKGDVDLAANTVTFKDTKNRSDHELPLTKRLSQILARRIAATPAESEWVFADGLGRPMQNLRYAQARVRAASGVSFCPHDLRRVAATAMERESVPQYTLKAVLNHLPSSQDVTSGYVKVDAAMKLAALEKLGRFILAKKVGVVVPMVRRGAR